ncbi:MAG: hypothetical protein CMJ48_13070, partial [Planctomycetaceae bacterium]|nr:hypothetical protein [Planctomycetaceae bacterium]
MRIALATVTILITTTLTAQAQPPAPRTRTRPRAALNPAHEKMKIQADQAYQKGDFQRSVELTSVVLSQNPTDHVAYYLRASANVELGQTNGNAAVVRRGITDAREALRISDTRDADYYLPYLYGMTILARMENKKEHAKIVVSVATPIIGRPTLTDEEKANLLYQRAMGQVVLEEFEKAATDFQTATKLVPSHLGAFVALADSYVAAGKTELAVNAFANAVKAFPSDPLVHNNQGSHFQQQGKNQEAIAAFTRALELDVNYFVAYTNRGFALMESGQLEAAESDFSASLKVNPQQP